MLVHCTVHTFPKYTHAMLLSNNTNNENQPGVYRAVFTIKYRRAYG